MGIGDYWCSDERREERVPGPYYTALAPCPYTAVEVHHSGAILTPLRCPTPRQAPTVRVSWPGSGISKLLNKIFTGRCAADDGA